jgi:hypothetical protein
MCLVTVIGDRLTADGDPADAVRSQNLSLRFGSNRGAGRAKPLA